MVALDIISPAKQRRVEDTRSNLNHPELDHRMKVPEVTLIFWIIKIAATTLGETAGDAVSMSMNLGYLVGTAIFAVFLAIAGAIQISLQRFHPLIYWMTIVATTTFGTTVADFLDRSLGIGYFGGVLILLLLLAGTLVLWYRALGSVSIDTISSRKSEVFYWVTIIWSQTLGTALGDWTADTAGVGYLGGTALFAALLVMIAILYVKTNFSRTALFWCAFVITRPLGAVVGDFLDKPVASGGLNLSRYSASAALLAFMVGCILLSPQREAQKH